MQITFSSQIIDIINALCDKFGIAIDWTSENIMPKIQHLVGEYCQYETATSWMWIIVFSSLFALFLIVTIIAFACDADSDLGTALCIITVILLIVDVCVVCTQSQDILACKYFPEKAALDYIKDIAAKYNVTR